MSRGDLQEMEVGTKQSKTAVNSGASAADPMPKMADPGTQLAGVEDLGGPTPDNYKPDDDSAKLKTAEGLKQVKDVVTKGAKSADPMKGMKEEEEVDNEDFIEEEEETTDEVVEEETEETTEEDTEVVEEEEIVEAEYDIDEDVDAIIGDENLSEEFRERAKTIFEAALVTKVKEVQESLEEQYATALVEEVQEIKEALTERVDSYLEYVAEEWFIENTLAIEGGLKEELTESFMTGLKGLFEEHYVSIPEEKYNVLESMVEKLDDMETKLNEQIEKNVSLNKRLAESVADGILDEISEGLADTQKDKLASLAENIEFDREEQYREKLETIRESYFSANKSSNAKTESLSEGISNEGFDSYSPSMAAILKNLGSISK